VSTGASLTRPAYEGWAAWCRRKLPAGRGLDARALRTLRSTCLLFHAARRGQVLVVDSASRVAGSSCTCDQC
jgi:hypothetical protein